MTLEVTLTHFYNPCLQYFRYCSRKPNYSLFALLSCHNNTYKKTQKSMTINSYDGLELSSALNLFWQEAFTYFSLLVMTFCIIIFLTRYISIMVWVTVCKESMGFCCRNNTIYALFLLLHYQSGIAWMKYGDTRYISLRLDKNVYKKEKMYDYIG